MLFGWCCSIELPPFIFPLNATKYASYDWLEALCFLKRRPAGVTNIDWKGAKPAKERRYS